MQRKHEHCITIIHKNESLDIRITTNKSKGKLITQRGDVYSTAPTNEMRFWWCEGWGLPSGGVGNGVVSGNEGITEEGVLMVVCLLFV